MLRLLAVNYHYLESPGKKHLKNKGVAPVLFKKQLVQLKKYYQPITFKQYLEICQKKQAGNYVIVSFDDGLKDILKAGEIAKSLNFPLSFFFCSSPISGINVLMVQKIHLLLEKIPLNKLARQFYQTLNQSQAKIIRKKPKKLNLNNAYPYDQGQTRKFKLDLNYLLPASLTQPIISQIFKRYFPDEQKISQEIYLNLKQIKALYKQGFEIGGHSHRHLLLAGLPQKEREEEIRLCRKYLNKIEAAPLPFSAPFGHLGTFNQNTIQLLKKYRFFNLVSMERKININNFNQYNISRFDDNDVFDKNKLKKQFKL